MGRTVIVGEAGVRVLNFHVYPFVPL
jgi:hypothetical protein